MHHVIESIGALAGLENLYFDTVRRRTTRFLVLVLFDGPEQHLSRWLHGSSAGGGDGGRRDERPHPDLRGAEGDVWQRLAGGGGPREVQQPRRLLRLAHAGQHRPLRPLGATDQTQAATRPSRLAGASSARGGKIAGTPCLTCSPGWSYCPRIRIKVSRGLGRSRITMIVGTCSSIVLFCRCSLSRSK